MEVIYDHPADMTDLSPKDALHVQAAQDFLKASNPAGAQAEIDQLIPPCLDRPEVLEIRWELAAQAGNWDLALQLATSLTQLALENEFAWLWLSCSLNELGRSQEAYDALVAAFQRLPKSPMIAYNLACCSCRLKRLSDAWTWVTKAIEVGGRANVKLMALDDPDLAPLLDRICAL